jgi:hypothetical protein
MATATKGRKAGKTTSGGDLAEALHEQPGKVDMDAPTGGKEKVTQEDGKEKSVPVGDNSKVPIPFDDVHTIPDNMATPGLHAIIVGGPYNTRTGTILERANDTQVVFQDRHSGQRYVVDYKDVRPDYQRLR